MQKYDDSYEKYYADLVLQDGVYSAFAHLKSAYKINPIVKSDCHQITHAIGRAAAKKYNDVGEAFEQGDSFCWSGYYHGVMEGVSSAMKLENLTRNINLICSKIKGKESYSFDYYNCVHGLGHGFMYVNDNELFESLRICDNLNGTWEQGTWEQSSCYGGVFMENIISNNKYHFTKYLKSEDVFYPCNAVDEKYKYSCYLMQTSYALDVNGWDFAKAFKLCEKIDESYVDTCYQSLGRDASGYTESSAIKTRNICMLGKNTRQKSNCVIGAVKDFAAYFHSDVEGNKLCSSLPAELKDACFETLQNFVNNF